MPKPDTTHWRPSPDALLEQVQKEGRGKLKIFLGAAPGVGKTYAMLEDARALVIEGADVAIGVVETHGRKETEALTADMEIIPRKTLEYRGKTFNEMDIDAILARNPAIVLVDELAHTNIEGSRHPKRYQDVEELLEAGIDVFSTLNIQHIESLNDVVTRVSGIQVKETVPDSIVGLADEIELIDIPPKELQKRLQEGKVYVEAQAKQAIKNFFTQNNLTALREMALRFAAERVDNQMLKLIQAQGGEATWSTRERLMVCVGESYNSMELVRICSQTANLWKAPWVAVHIDTVKQANLSSEADFAAKALLLAEELGGETTTIAGENVLEEIISFAKSHNITRVIIGKSKRQSWFRRFVHRSLSIQLCEATDAFKVVVVPTEDVVVLERKEQRKKFKGLVHLSNYVVATLASLSAGLLAYIVETVLPLPNVSLVFLLAVLFIAIRYGLTVSLYTITLSFLLYNFLFTEPRFTFSISQEEQFLTVLFFVLVAVVISRLAARIRDQVTIVKQNAERTANLYAFSQKVSIARDLDTVMVAVVHHVEEITNKRTSLLLPGERKLAVRAGFHHLDDVSRGAAEWAWKKGEMTGYSTRTLPGSPWFFIPMQTDSGVIGVLGIEFSDKDQTLLFSQRKLLETLSHQAAMAIERSQALENMQQSRLFTETERLRSALLSSISHDFRTPLSSIIGCITNLQNYGKGMDDTTREELQDSIHQEAERLNRYVQNLLDMTRHGSGELKPRKDWVDINDIVNSARGRIGKLLYNRKLILNIQKDLPLLYVDPVLIEQVVVNILDNACNYSAENTSIWIKAMLENDHFIIEIMDEGKGINEEERERVFDMFYRVNAEDKQAAGTGLGLAICRGIVEAHEGSIVAVAGDNNIGTKMVITLPYYPVDVAAHDKEEA